MGRRGLSVGFAHVPLPDQDLEVGLPDAIYEHDGLTPLGVLRKATDFAHARLILSHGRNKNGPG